MIFFQIIIRAFKFIVRFNTFMSNQRYINLNILYQHVLNARRVYQNLIIYVISIIKGFRNQNENKNKHDFENEKEALNEILLIVTHTNSKIKGLHISKFMIIIIIKDKKIKEKDKRKIKNNKFEKLFKLFNVYADLHFINNVKEYATIINSNVLIEKLKHKLFILFSHYRRN